MDMENLSLRLEAEEALEQAVQFSFDEQKEDGHWVAETSSDATFTSEYVMFKYAVGLDLTSDGDAIKRWLLRDQKADGSWGLAPELPGNISTTTEAYLALKILGVSPDEKDMLKARNFMQQNGGVAKVRFFTRFFLATFGLFPWSAIPQLPAELILLPASSPLNIYTLSSWARSTMIPVLVVAHHKPLYALPNGRSADNDFLDELSFGKAIGSNSFYGGRQGPGGGGRAHPEHPHEEDGSEAMCRLAAGAPGGRGRLGRVLPADARQRVGLDPGGVPLDHDVIRRGLSALERLAVQDEGGKRLTATVSPIWDTSLMAVSMCDAGVGSDPRMVKAAEWLRCRQLMGPEGDWRVYSPCQQPGGWSFQYHNRWYPDVDDTAVVVMALAKQDAGWVESDSCAHALTWILGMQNHDGGWGAFDCYNDKLWLHKIPFSDMDSLCDPSTADVTGRILECFGLMLSSYGTKRLSERMAARLAASAARAVEYLLKEQEETGPWWGRWGSNYIYGSGNVLRGLVHFGKSNPKVNDSLRRAVSWFESIQNPDGGWGESLASYEFPKMAGRGGPSNAAQTAWALQSLLLFRPASSPRIRNGISWLVQNQTVESENGGASWPADFYTGTGFPGVLYLGYPLYHHAFPVMALSKYLAVQKGRCTGS
ncbi:squalene cyclase [Apiospora saccharicola]